MNKKLKYVNKLESNSNKKVELNSIKRIIKPKYDCNYVSNEIPKEYLFKNQLNISNIDKDHKHQTDSLIINSSEIFRSERRKDQIVKNNIAYQNENQWPAINDINKTDVFTEKLKIHQSIKQIFKTNSDNENKNSQYKQSKYDKIKLEISGITQYQLSSKIDLIENESDKLLNLSDIISNTYGNCQTNTHQTSQKFLTLILNINIFLTNRNIFIKLKTNLSR